MADVLDEADEVVALTVDGRAQVDVDGISTLRVASPSPSLTKRLSSTSIGLDGATHRSAGGAQGARDVCTDPALLLSECVAR